MKQGTKFAAVIFIRKRTSNQPKASNIYPGDIFPVANHELTITSTTRKAKTRYRQCSLRVWLYCGGLQLRFSGNTGTIWRVAGAAAGRFDSRQYSLGNQWLQSQIFWPVTELHFTAFGPTGMGTGQPLRLNISPTALNRVTLPSRNPCWLLKERRPQAHCQHTLLHNRHTTGV